MCGACLLGRYVDDPAAKASAAAKKAKPAASTKTANSTTTANSKEGTKAAAESEDACLFT